MILQNARFMMIETNAFIFNEGEKVTVNELLPIF